MCEFVSKVLNGTRSIGSENKEGFVKEYRYALEETKGRYGVVYVFKSKKIVQRLKGSSNILYIGKTQNDVCNRYNVQNDAEAFWPVYSHVVKNYGKITIDVFVTSDPSNTESKFLVQYYKEHYELPPINRKG